MSTAAQTRAWRRNNPEKAVSTSLLWRQNQPASYLFCRTRQRANSYGIPFELTRDWVAERLAPMVCEETGLPLTLDFGTAKQRNPWSPSIDRRDSQLGYLPGNCRVVCWAFNCACSSWGDDTVLRLARALVARRDFPA